MKLRRLFLLKLLQYDDWFVQKHLHVAYISQQKYSFNFRLLHTLNKKKPKRSVSEKYFKNTSNISRMIKDLPLSHPFLVSSTETSFVGTFAAAGNWR